MEEVDTGACTLFIHEVQAYYAQQGRRTLPWRRTKNAYRILVSEVMLQQTQVDRVIPKYNEFLKKFPSVRALADAPFKEVVGAWQGLGYNRRALFLHKASTYFLLEHNGVIPQSRDELECAPGIGPYTAGAVRAFAFNAPEVFIETNIRTAFIHFFFATEESVSDAQLMPLIAYCVAHVPNPREWYWALMDYGSYLKKTGVNPSRKSAHYVVQKKFKGSVRELRGKILKVLLHASEPLTVRKLEVRAHISDDRIEAVLTALCAEGLLTKHKKGTYSIT